MARSTRLLAAAALAAGAVYYRRRREKLWPVNPELYHPLLMLPLSVSSRVVLRVLRRIPVPGVPVPAGVSVARRDSLYVYTPRQLTGGALLWIHGGGFVLGDPVSYHEECGRFAAELGLVVVSVDYRLAPEHPFPAGLDDCYAALTWLHAHAAELGVDPDRIAIGGDSAGGGLAACLAQLAHDRGELPVRFQLLIYPMLDDRTALRAGPDALVWTPASNRFGWTAYLGHPPRPGEPRPYAAAARRDDLTGLPPAWIGVGDIDLFHAEDVDYANRLAAAGVPCDLHVVAGMYHGADVLVRTGSAAVDDFRDSMLTALREALTGAAAE